MRPASVYNAIWNITSTDDDYKCTFATSEAAKEFIDAISKHEEVRHTRLVRIDFVERPTLIWSSDW